MSARSGSGGPSVDERIRRIAGRHRVVTRGALLDAGVADGAIRTRLRNGRLFRMHPGVYAVGAPADTHASVVLAAVRAVGPGARASHVTSAELLRLRAPGQGVPHVTGASPGRAPRGVVLHRTRRSDAGGRTCDGIPCTGVARTLVDLAAVHGAAEAVRAWRQADALRLLRHADVGRELALRRPGSAVVRRLWTEHLEHGTPRTVRELEDRAADLLRPPHLSRAAFNAPVRAEGRDYRVDVLWRSHGVAVELDSWIWHGTPESHAEDARRSLDLQLAGWQMVHLTWADLTRDAGTTVDRLRRLLHRAEARRGASGRGARST